MKNKSKIRLASIILISFGYGWDGGHYIPANSPLLAYSFQIIIICIILFLSIKYFSLSEAEINTTKWPKRAISILCGILLIINVLNAIHGAVGNASNFGSHNTIADLIPIFIVILGTSLWLITFESHNIEMK